MLTVRYRVIYLTERYYSGLQNRDWQTAASGLPPGSRSQLVGAFADEAMKQDWRLIDFQRTLNPWPTLWRGTAVEYELLLQVTGERIKVIDSWWWPTFSVPIYLGDNISEPTSNDPLIELRTNR